MIFVKTFSNSIVRCDQFVLGPDTFPKRSCHFDEDGRKGVALSRSDRGPAARYTLWFRHPTSSDEDPTNGTFSGRVSGPPNA